MLFRSSLSVLDKMLGALDMSRETHRKILIIWRRMIAIFIAVMCILETALVTLKVYSYLGSLNWGTVFIPTYLILAMHPIGFYTHSIWWALLSFIVIFTIKLNQSQGMKFDGEGFIFLMVIESTVLIIELTVICYRCICQGDQYCSAVFGYSSL